MSELTKIERLFFNLEELIREYFEKNTDNSDEIEKELLFLEKQIIKLEKTSINEYNKYMFKYYSISYSFYKSNPNESSLKEAALAKEKLNKYQEILDERDEKSDKQDSNPESSYRIDSNLDDILNSLKEYFQMDKFTSLKTYFDLLKKGSSDFDDYQKLLKAKGDVEKLLTCSIYELIQDTDENTNENKLNNDLSKLECLNKFYFRQMKIDFMQKVLCSKKTFAVKKLFGNYTGNEDDVNKRYRLLSLVFHEDKNLNETTDIKQKCKETFDLIARLRNELLEEYKIFEYLDEEYFKENLQISIDYNNARLKNWDNLKKLSKIDLTNLTNDELKSRCIFHAVQSYNGYKRLCKSFDLNNLQSEMIMRKRVAFRRNISRSLLYLDKLLEAQIYCISAIHIIINNFNDPFTYNDLNSTKALLDEIKNSNNNNNNNNKEKSSKESNSNFTNSHNELVLSNVSSRSEMKNFSENLNKELESVVQQLYLTPNNALVSVKNKNSFEFNDLINYNLTARLSPVINVSVMAIVANIPVLNVLAGVAIVGSLLFKEKNKPKVLPYEVSLRKSLNKIINEALDKYNQNKINDFFKCLQTDDLIWKSEFNNNNAIKIVDYLLNHGVSPDSIGYLLNLIGEALISNMASFPNKHPPDLKTKAIEFFEAVDCVKLKEEASNIDNKVFKYLTNNVRSHSALKDYVKLIFGFTKSYDENQIAKEYMKASQEMLIETRLREMSFVAKINIILIRLVEKVNDAAIKQYNELKQEIHCTFFELNLAEYKLQAIEDLLKVIAGYKEVADFKKLAITEKNSDKYSIYIESRLKYETNINSDLKPIYQKAASYEEIAKVNFKKGLYEKSLENWQFCLMNYLKILNTNKSNSFVIIKVAYCYIKLFNYEKAINLLVNNENLIKEKFRAEFYLYLSKAFRKIKHVYSCKLSIQKATLFKIDTNNKEIIDDLNNEKALIENLNKINDQEKLKIHKELKFLNTKNNNKRSTYKILSIDGGGTRGIIPSYWLMELERIIRKPICQMFDLVAGVSTGALISAGLTIPDQTTLPKYKAFDIYNLYLNESKEIFQLNNLFSRLIGTQPKYSGDGRYRKFNQYIGDFKLDRCLTDLVIPAIRIDYYNTTPFCFNRYDARRESFKNISVVDALMATSAAPTYFPAYEIEELGVFVDGGVQCNNPTEIALNEALRYGFKQDDLFILSLGTGTYLESSLDRVNSEDLNSSWLGWIHKIHKVSVGAQSASVNESIRNRFENNFDRYHRWQLWFQKLYELDSFDEKDLKDLSNCAEEYFEETQITNEDSFHKLIHTLSD